MKKILLAASALLASVALAGCGNVNSFLADRHETVEIYHIFDAKTNASPDAIIKAAADGLARNTNNVTTTRPLNLHGSKTLPEEAGRFDVIDVADAFKGTGMASILALSQNNAGALNLKQAKCENALWTARAVRDIPGSNRLTLYVCAYRYVKGYQFDMYANFQKVEGGINGIGLALASAAIGTPDEWVNKTIVDTMRSVEQVSGGGAKISHVEGQPEIGNLPWVDKYDAKTASN